MKNTLFCTLLCMCLSASSYGQIQTVQDLTKQIIPPSPTAASLGKYGHLPVTYHTGAVAVSIPIYEMKIGALQLPVSLSYQTSGIKVTDVASRVGLGWTLQGEGAITRTVRGLPDEDGMGWAMYLGAQVVYTEAHAVTDQYKIQLMELAAKGQIDCEPDMYAYNFMGHSGKFYFDNTGKVIMVPHNKLKIQANSLSSFTITDENGTLYYFNAAESTTTNNSTALPLSHYSSWYLTRVLTLKNEEILFTYSNPGPITYGFLLSETDYYSSNGGSKLPQQTVANQVIGTARLQSVETRVEKMEFDYLIPRQDLSGDYQLDDIRIFSKISHSYVKQIDFNYEYSSASGTCVNAPNLITSAHDYKRLKLVSVTEHPYGTATPGKKHRFVYNPTPLPPRCSADQDHWGYYNAKGNITLKPRLSFLPPTYPAGNRETNPLTVGAESLVEVHYPTGGYTRLDYAVHGYMAQVPRDSLLTVITNIDNANMGVSQSVNFTVNAAQLVNIAIDYHYSVYDGSGASVVLLKEGAPFFIRTLNASDQVNDGGTVITPSFSLPPGNYTLVSSNTGDVDGTTIHATLHYYHTFQVTRTNYLGGLAIKALSDYTEDNQLASKMTFTYEDIQILNPVSEVNYYHSLTEVSYADCAPSATANQYDYVVRASSNNFVMATSLGSHVGYGKVTATRAGVNAGKTVYEYTTDGDLGSGISFPFAPPTSREHRRGLLKREAHYDQTNTLLKETLTTYDFTPVDSMGAFKIGLHYDDLCYDDWSLPAPTTSHMSLGVYRMVGEWIKKTATIQNSYPGPIQVRENVYYGNINHLQPTRKEVTQSDGRLNIEFFTYPDDYPDNSGFIQTMKDANVRQSVIEHVTASADGNGSHVMITGGSLRTYYNLYNSKAGYLNEVKILETTAPIPLTSFQFSGCSPGVLPYQGTATAFNPDSRYAGNVFYDSYDGFGNVTQFHMRTGQYVSVRWGYKSSRPLVLIQHASSNEFFYEGFEEGAYDSTGAVPVSGRKFKATAFTAPFNKPNTRTYVLSYYKLHAEGHWDLHTEILMSNNPVIDPGVAIDEVFIYPHDSDFKLMSYDPGSIQTSSVTDNTHTLQYFTYDPLHRLESIRDYNRDIVNSFLYNYKSN